MTRFILIAISLVYVIIATLFATQTPDWQTPDEPAHYNYIQQIAENGRLPFIEMGDWDQAYLDELRSTRFDAALLDNIDTIQYEDHQPPLYYLIATPVYLLTDGSLTALRLFSMLFGLVIIICAYGIGQALYPDRPQIGLGAAALVAFVPQHVHILASVNNDTLAWAVIAVTLLLTIHYVISDYPQRNTPILLGMLVGIGFITKSTTYFMGGIVVLAILLRWWRAREIDLSRHIVLFLIPALILGGLWWGRNIAVYGFPDFLGLARHDAVVVGQPRTAELIDRIGFNGFIEEITRVTFNSFWGQFGWMAVPMQTRFYQAILGLLLLALAGWMLDTGRSQRQAGHQNGRYAWLLLLATTVLAIMAFIYYNTEFQQHQGRYIFPMLIPLGLWLALGLDVWRRYACAYLPKRLQAISPYATVAIICLFAPLNIWLLWRVIVPNLS